mgnify:CR=1 FL=1|tara:strand:+ start:580 stop:750 length:171 start_codon:yes stop_codon:yes gene_type:complete
MNIEVKDYDITFIDAYGNRVTDRARGKNPELAIANLHSLNGFIQKIISVKILRETA